MRGAALGWGFFLFLGLRMGKGEATGIAAECGEGEGVPSEDFSPPTANAVRSEELPSSMRVTSLDSRVSRAPEESKKEEAMCVPKRVICSWKKVMAGACAKEG